MRAIAAGSSDIGRQRAHNEDRYILLPEYNVFVVADGMGGHQSGEVASRMAASVVAGYFRAGAGDGVDVGRQLRAAVSLANARIFSRADDSRAHRGMGTTIVAAAFDRGEGSFHVAYAGDSRAYRMRGGELHQLTRDHSLVADALLERPDLSEADLAYLPRNVITRALGIGPTVELDVRADRSEPGDVYLLCSDGLHSLVPDAKIAAVMRAGDVLTDTCARLIDLANDHGGKDNITAVLVQIEASDEPWSQRAARA